MKSITYLASAMLLASCTAHAPTPKRLGEFSRQELKVDTIAETQNVMLVNKEAFDSLKTVEKGLSLVEVPLTSKRVKWFSIDYVADGSTVITIIAEDDQKYGDFKISGSDAAATTSLLSSNYVRIDTTSKILHLYVYKSQPATNSKEAFKAF
jgi:hypothetical protein